MNQNIKAAANEYTNKLFDNGVIISKGDYDGFLAGATYFQQSSGADEMAEALERILSHDWNSYNNEMDQEDIDVATAALAKYNSFIKKEEDGKENNYNIK